MVMIAVLDNLRSAQNVGSIIRTCDALGIKEIYLCGITPDHNNKKVLKTSLGAEQNIKINIVSSTRDALTKIRKRGFKIIGLEINKKSQDINEFTATGDFALVIGNEVSGISDEIIESCDHLLHIPMQGIKESLNVSVAFGIASYVVLNQSTCRSEQKE
ncbi:TrmH family RNA methyltransferase [Patescibacteria group bacterium]|nr:TrmH family RNA methyltransferase [Patescibacteria group bacterium]